MKPEYTSAERNVFIIKAYDGGEIERHYSKADAVNALTEINLEADATGDFRSYVECITEQVDIDLDPLDYKEHPKLANHFNK